MTADRTAREGLKRALSDGIVQDACCARWIADRQAELLLAIPEVADLLAKADSAERMEAERDEARADRDALVQAAGFKPGPLGDGLKRKVVLDDIAGMRPAMVKARRAAEQVRDDADLWTMRMLEEWPGDTLLLRLWRQRREATKAAKAALAEAACLTAEVEALRGERDEARQEVYDLKLAAAGGEDVPGSAELVTADDVKRWREEDAAQIVAAEIGRERAVLAFTVYVESGHGGAMHEAVQWLRAGARGPVPYPDGACFRAWADQNGIGNRDGFLSRTDQPEGTGSPAVAQDKMESGHAG